MRIDQPEPGDPSTPPAQAQVLARVTVAALRSALIRHRELRATKTAATPPLEQLLHEAFATITASAAQPNPTATDPAPEPGDAPAAR